MTTSIFGSAVRRAEDPRFLSGEGRYVENLPIDGGLRAVFVRSMMAHARLTGIDPAAALAMPGVAGVFTAGDIDLPPQPPGGTVAEAFSRPVLAGDVVRFVGPPRPSSSTTIRCPQWWIPTARLRRTPRSCSRRPGPTWPTSSRAGWRRTPSGVPTWWSGGDS
ncbi:MAG: hypothetical protein HYU54_06080 [Actinobacteria bacterium]|nr:hypothetical protein [Actinomycetota bacterium]